MIVFLNTFNEITACHWKKRNNEVNHPNVSLSMLKFIVQTRALSVHTRVCLCIRMWWSRFVSWNELLSSKRAGVYTTLCPSQSLSFNTYVSNVTYLFTGLSLFWPFIKRQKQIYCFVIVKQVLLMTHVQNLLYKLFCIFF